MDELTVLQSMRQDVASKLKEKRFLHTLSVTEVALDLAYIHKCHPVHAQMAALLHDVCKFHTLEEMHQIFDKHHYIPHEHEKFSRALLHGKAAAYYSLDTYKINHETFGAIYYHTTGRPHMTTLEKVIYVSDYIEPLRGHIDYIQEARQYAYKDLDKAMYFCLKGSCEYLEKQDTTVDPLTLETFHYYDHLIH